MNIIKPLSTSISLSSTANNFANSTLVYIATTNTASINVAFSNGTTKSSFVLPANQYIFVVKESTDLLSANTAVEAVAAAYRG